MRQQLEFVGIATVPLDIDPLDFAHLGIPESRAALLGLLREVAPGVSFNGEDIDAAAAELSNGEVSDTPL